MNRETFISALVETDWVSRHNAEQFTQQSKGGWSYADPGGTEAWTTSINTIKLIFDNPFRGRREEMKLKVEIIMIPQIKVTKIES